MDFLDPRKQKVHARRLLFGYLLIGMAILLMTTILLYRAYGYVLGKNGQIVQQGLVFISSQPNPANLYVNRQLDGTTNKRLFLQAGQYTFSLVKSGYRPWVRAITVEGGSVEHFDYPTLFPVSLQSSVVKEYSDQPGIVLQSPSRQWLLVPSSTAFGKFDEFDLHQKTPTLVNSTQTSLTIPSNVLTSSSGSQSWEFEEWSTDNRHVILKHIFEVDGQAATEYILLDRQDPTQSVNLTNTLGTNPSKLEFINPSDYTQYYVYNQDGGNLDTASLSAPAPQPYLRNVLSFKPYSSNVLLYATSDGAPGGKVAVDLRQGSTTYPIRQLNAANGATYLLNFTQYNGNWFIAAGSSAGNNIYIYRDPQAELQADPNQALAPISILKMANASQLVFSANAQFIMTESGSSFAVYDAENNKNYAYHINAALDSPQQYATWMDGDRIMYVTAGKLYVFEYDHANPETLMPALPNFLPAFDSSYRYVYSFTIVPANGNTPTQTALNATALLTPSDL